MKAAIVWLLVCVPVLADSPLVSGVDDAGLRLVGPTECEPGEPITIVVHGLPAVDLAAPIGDQVAWVDSMRFVLSAPGDTPELSKELAMTVAPWGWLLRVTFTPEAPGTYLLVCDWNEAPYGLAVHRISARGPPEPEEPVDPTNPPLTTKPTAVTYVYEKDQTNPPREVQAALNQLNAAGSLVASVFEQDTTDGDGDTPEQYQAALTAAKAAGLPCLVVLAGDRVLRVVRDPQTLGAVLEAVK